MIDSIKQYIVSNFCNGFRGQLRFIQISSASEKAFDAGRIIYLFFKDNDKEPFLISKFSKTEKNNSNIKNEYEMTRKLFGIFPKIISEPMGIAQIYGRDVFFQKAEVGKTITNNLYFLRNTPYSTEESFIKYAMNSVEFIGESFGKFNAKAEKVDRNALNIEITNEFNEFITNFKLNKYEASYLTEKIEEIINLLDVNGVYKRIVNYDLTPFNIVDLGEVKKIIDLEYCKESTLTIIEPLRYIFTLYKDLFNLEFSKYTMDENNSFYIFLSDVNNPVFIEFNKIIKNNFGFDVDRNTRKLLCMLLFVIEGNMQYRVKEFKDVEFLKFNRINVNYFSGAYLDEEVFVYENSRISEAYHFLSIKDDQISACEENIITLNNEINRVSTMYTEANQAIAEYTNLNKELVDENNSYKNRIEELEERIIKVLEEDIHKKDNEIDQLKNIIADKNKEISLLNNSMERMKNTKAWKYAEKIRRINKWKDI